MVKKEKKELVVKGVSLIITAFVIFLLVLSGPASAFTLSLNIPDTQASKGGSINFTGEIEINSDENLPIDNVLLKLDGSEVVNCLFHPNGTIISGCKGISIEPLGNASFEYGYGYGYYGYGYNFGYGYGYTNGKLIYNFTLNTTDYLSGNYSTELTAYINSKEFSNTGDNIIIGEAVNITDLPVSPACAYETDNITVSANITGSVSEVWVETNISGALTNHTTSQNGDVYSAVVNGVGGQNLSWRFVVKDVFDDLVYGDWNSIYIIKRTSLTINPPNPDGLNSWYITEPLFTLENSDSSEIYYRWNSTGDLLYAAPFGLDDIPNAPPKESAGTLELNYWGNTTCGIEQEQTIIIKVDLTNPLIKDLVPENDSVVYNDLRPTIQAYLDEVYQGNSGIDKGSIIMKLDGSTVSKQTINADTLDVIVRHNPITDLSEGLHEVYVYTEDNAGRSSELTWMFEINLTAMFNLTVYSPENITYNTRRVPFDITTTEIVEEIEYINHEDTSPRWRSLCRDCDEYGHTREKTKSLNEGENDLTIRATDRFGSSKEENIILFIDSRDPRILKTEPKRGFADGNFYVEFREDNPKNLTLFYGNSIRSEELDLENDCYENRGKHYCEINVNLSDYDGQEIEYWFVLEDVAGNTDESKHEELDVDYSPPIINSAEYYSDGRSDYIRVEFEEANLDEITYLDLLDERLRERSLCRRAEDGFCEGRVRLGDGLHNITIKAADEAGYEAFYQMDEFFTDSRDPRIRGTEPRRGFASGLFEVEFDEENPEELWLNYGNEIIGWRNSLVNLSECVEGRYTECSINVNLSDYDGQEIEYWFNLTDIVGNYDESRPEELDVDYSPPIINSAEYVNGRRGEIIVNITEINLDEVEYIDNNDERASWRTLCRRLDRDDGLCRGRARLDDGLHNITIKAVDEAGYETFYQMAEFFTDSRDPRIRSTEPRRGFASGLFEVEFDEENPEELWLNYGNAVTGWRNHKVNLSNCTMNRYTECSVNVNLSDYHGQEIEYWFNLTDIVGNYDESEPEELDVDIVAPILNNPDSFWERGEGRYEDYIYFNMSITEENFDEAVLNYDYRGRTRDKRLCSRLRDGGCEKRFTTRDDYSDFKLIIRDDAGNLFEKELDFS